ncbi:MAG: prenyltransferase [Candidatus Azobacteroides sp.]|nr:prenyltransferase [Candidatus Azobacteroides sp.]
MDPMLKEQNDRVLDTFRFWINNARSTALPQSILPGVLAVCMASQVKGFSAGLGILAVLGVIIGHLGINLFDDYFDYKVKGTQFRDVLAQKGFRSRIAKCHYITSGATDLDSLLTAACAFSLTAMLIGGVLFVFREYFIAAVAFITAILGISYSGPPLRLSYRGLGEFVIGIVFGPLLMIGVYYSACGRFDGSVLFVSIPVGLLVANIVYTHAIMDYEPDKEVGKMTLAVLLKNKNAMLCCLAFFLLAAFASIIAGVISGYLSKYYLLTLLAFPMACALFYLMVQFVRYPQKKFSPRFWMGPMSNWPLIQKNQLEWFMIRWLLARNLLSFFCLIVIVVSFLS